MYLSAKHYLIALFTLVPLVHWQGVYYTHDTPKFFLLDIGLCLFVWFQLQVRTIRLTLPACLLIGSIAYSAVTLLWAPNLFAGLIMIVRLSLAGLALWSLLQHFNNTQLTRLLLITSTVSAAAFCCVFFIERLLGLPQLIGSFTPIGFINNAGHVMVIWIPCLLLSLWKSRHWLHRILLVFTLISLVYILMLCAIRSSISALLLSELLIFALLLYKDRKQALVFLSVSVLLISGIVLFKYSDALQKGRLSAKLATLQSSLSISYQPRLNMLLNSKDMLLDNPLGVGVNNFEFVHPKYAKTGTEFASPMVTHTRLLKTPHNIFATFYTELGWPGGTLLSALLIYYLWQAWRAAWSGGISERWLCVAYSALLINAQFSAVFLTPVSLAFAVLLIAAIHGNANNKTLYCWTPSRNLLCPLKSAVAGFSLATSCAFFASEVLSKHGMLTLNTEQLTRAVRLNPGNERAWLMLSQVHLIKTGDEQQSLAALLKFRALNPENLHGRYAEAQAYYRLQNYPQALVKVSALLAYHPHDQPAIALCHKITKAMHSTPCVI